MTYYYEIKTPKEEFHCHVCDSLVSVGDKALMVECPERESTFPVCSKDCNECSLREWEDMNEPSQIDDFHCYAQ